MREVHFSFGDIQVIAIAPDDISDEQLAEMVIEDVLAEMSKTGSFPEAEQCLAAH